ncbi:MAG: DUF2807 domain-containing protein [Armatimonadetes bacterium]|nr:DUF2807 domain-containing protein [Armatimonadota bacterium]
MKIAFGVAAALLLGGCFAFKQIEGSGVEATKTHELDTFNRIELKGSADLVVTVGVEQSVTVRGDDNLVELIEIEVKGGTLVIKTPNNMRPRVGLSVEIQVPSLDGLALAGSGDIEVSGVQSDDFSLEIAGSGNINVANFQGESLSVEIAGSGDVTLSGEAEELTIEIAGSGDVKARELITKRVDVSIAGSGDADVHATESLNVSIAGSGDVTYSGDPADVEKSVLGSGDVKPG